VLGALLWNRPLFKGQRPDTSNEFWAIHKLCLIIAAMALTRYTLRQFEAFVTVAELLSFGASAERMGLTAQAVSQLVAELESLLGFRLFERTTRRVVLSSGGRDFLASAQSVLHHLNSADSVADDVRNRAAGVVRIGAPMVLASAAVPAAIRDFSVQRPKIAVRICDLPVDRMIDAVVAGDVDLAVGPDRPVSADVLSEPLFDSPWVLWCATDHPLAKKRKVRWEDLHLHALVAAGRDHEISVSLMHRNTPEGSRIMPVHVVDNISTALGITAQGLAATLAPAYVGVLAQSFGLVMKRVVEPEVIRKVCLYRSKVRQPTPAAQGFAMHLSDWLPRWAAQQS
jgi:DNA-binding transcriptional LysR family regulator